MLNYNVKIGLVPLRRDCTPRPGIFNWEYAEERGRRTATYIEEHFSNEHVSFVDLKGVIDVEVLWSLDDVDKVEKSEKFEKVGSIEKRCIEEETEEELEKRDNYSTKESINPIDVITKKETLEKEETYMTYSVYLVRENDTIDKICEKYNVTKQDLEDYNDINSVTPGIKLIIPNLNE